MLVPLFGLILGIVLLSYTFLAYTGHPILEKTPVNIPVKGNKWFAIGFVLISIALMLGMIGYFIDFSGKYLRYLRLLLIVGGLIIVKITLENNFDKLGKVPKFIVYFIKLNSQDLLKLCGSILILSLFLKSILDVDWMGGDTWMKHLPFAARIWGMVTPQEYIFEHEVETFYGTSTMLANILQGFFWFIFGLQRPQGANLVSFFSLVIYFIFLRAYLKIPIYLSAITILAVPLIHIAATGCYIDLPGNIGASIAIIMTYLLYVRNDFLNRKNIIVFTLAAAAAANIKYLMVPPIFIIFSLAWLRIVWLYFPKWKKLASAIKLKKVTWFIAITLICSILIFATEFKNIVVYGNPFYPMKIEIAGIVLNHLMVPSSDYMSDKIQAMSPLQRWVFSLLEIGAFDDRRPWLWTMAMDYIPLHDDKFGMGGYFSVYVVFNLVLFFTLCRRWVKETRVALILFVIMSSVTVFLPFSYQLRYYMYWMITLISLNLYLAAQEQNSDKKLAFITPTNIGYVGLVILISFCIITRWDYTEPQRLSLARFMEGRAKAEIMAQIKDGDSVCLVNFAPLTFLYNSKFHPERNYVVKSEFLINQEYIEEKCGDRRIIYHK